jgi:hypothetical protein
MTARELSNGTHYRRETISIMAEIQREKENERTVLRKVKKRTADQPQRGREERMY